MFNLFVIFFLISSTPAASVKDSSNNTVTQEEFKIGLRASSTFHVPIDHAGDFWKPYPTFGLKIDLPTYIPKVTVHFTAETGLIAKKNSTIDDIDLLYASAVVSYSIILKGDKIMLRPFAGLSNMIINVWDLDEDNPLDLPAGKSENEFGFTAGIEPVLKIKKFSLGLPLSENIILSSPDSFITFNISLSAGMIF